MGSSITHVFPSLDRCSLFGFPPGHLKAGAQGPYYGISIAIAIRSVDLSMSLDHALSTRLIAPYKAVAYYVRWHDSTDIRRFSVLLL